MISVEKASLKMLVLDLDGTILNDKKEIIPENVEAIKELKKRNPDTLICVATGRTYTTSIKFVREIGANFLIARDGEVIYSGFDHKKNVSKKVFNMSEQDGSNIFYQIKKPFVKMLCKSKTPLIKLWSKLSVLKCKIKLRFSSAEIKESGLNTYIKHLKKCKDNIGISKRSPFGTEKAIGPFSTDKGKAVIYIMEQLRKKGINLNRSGIAIIGNDYNDLEMLKLEGCQSYCPSNAIKPIKDLDNVYQLTGNNNDPCISELLENYGITPRISLNKFEVKAKNNSPNKAFIIKQNINKGRTEKAVFDSAR